MTTLAVTGGTGFVGGRLVRRAVDRGFTVRALTRRPQPAMDGVEWIPGDLADCDRLCDGADAVVHVAGVINARTAAEFEAGNIAGTRSVVAAAANAGVGRFVHVSSLAAREPGLSRYGASKAGSEAVIPRFDIGWAIVRPPAVYGPGDRETLELFRLATKGIALVPWRGRASFIHGDDLADALLTLAVGDATGIFEPDDGHADGYAHDEFAHLIGEAVGRRPAVLRVPKAGMLAGAALDTAVARIAGKLPKLSFDRARYFAHADWVSRGAPIPGWAPGIAARDGLAATVDWYRAAGWLS